MQKLTAQEARVLALYLKEGNLRPVAEALNVSINTVRTQRTRIMKKLGANSSIELTIEAIRRGLVGIKGLIEPMNEATARNQDGEIGGKHEG